MKTLWLGVIASALSVCALAFAGAAATVPAAAVAPAKPVKVIFKMTGKLSMSGTVYLKSADTVRTEVESAQMGQQMAMMMPGFGNKVVTIVDGKTAYLVSETLKTAIKMPEGTPMGRMMGPLDPAKLKDASKDLVKDGFKKTRTEKIGKDQCDVWKGTPKSQSKGKEGGKSGEATVWIRQPDQLPVKFEMKSDEGTMSATAEWNPKLADTLFKVPAGYKKTDMADLMGKMGKGKGAPGGVPGKAPGKAG